MNLCGVCIVHEVNVLFRDERLSDKPYPSYSNASFDF